MFRTKTDVDNHVRAVFRNNKLENERNLRSHNIAKLYLSVGDFDSARHYISTYLSVRPDHAGAYKVLGQAYEGLKQKEKALEAYKRSYELEPKQPDVVIKVCELLLETNPYLSPKVAQYWLERAQDIQAHHPVVFSLKKHMIASKGVGESPKIDDLEVLIKKEIDVRPKDANLQIQLLKLFLETNRKDVAYKHAVELEATGSFRQEILWYQCLSDVMKAYRESTPAAAENWEFHLHNVGALLQQVALMSYQETQHGHGHSQAVFELDQALFEANEVLKKKKKEKLLEECVNHASSQLCLHLGIVLLRSGKQSRLGWREYVKQAQPLLLLAALPRTEITPIVSKKEAIKKRLKIWEIEKAYCRSQAGHVVLAMAKEGASQFLNRVNQFCCLGWREKVYQRIFSTAAKEKDLSTSFFVHYEGFEDIPGNLPSPTSLMASDSLSQQMYPESLHHFVWLGLQNWSAQSKKNEFRLDHGVESPLSEFRLSRDFSCNVFENLQWSAGNLKWSGTESLSRLDVDAFLYASVFCAASTLKRQRDKGLISEDRPSVLPADLTEPLCSPEQGRWWNMAWQMHSGALSKSVSNPSYGEVRTLIQRGIEVIRVLGNHGLDVKLIVLLAKTFEDKASSLSARFEESSKAAQMDARAHVYWTTALTLLERMDKNEVIHMADNRLFRFEGDELSRTDIKALLEEGRFFMACRLMRAEQHEEAALSFNQLKSPYASFYQALMYKKMADNVIGDIRNENITSDMRSDHSILLLKARSALHLTLDRLRSPHMDPNHPLNSELGQHLDDVEGRLAHIELNMMNRNACDGTSDDSASSQNSVDEQGQHSATLTSSNVPNSRSLKKSFQCSTPRSRRAERSFVEKEARPSPERLDAQIRHLASTNDTLLQSVLEQNRAILASNKGILEALEKNQRAVQDMQTRISTLQNEVSKLKVSDAPTSKTVIEEMQQQFSEIRQEIAKLKINDIRASLVRDDKDEELYVFGDEEEAAEDPQLGSLPQFPATYQNAYQPLANNVQGAARRNVYQPTQPIVPPLLPHNFFPQTQVPVGVGRNVDPTSMLYSQNLMSCYTALGLPFDSLQQTAQQAQVPDYASSQLVSLLYGNQQAAAAAAAVAQPAAAANVLRPQFTPVMPFGSPAVNLRPPTLPSTPVVAPSTQTEMSTPRFGADLAPHNYQISMPAQPTIPSAASVEKNLSPSQPISTSALLKDIPSPIYSAVSTPAMPPSKQSPVKQSPAERQSRTSICSEDGSYVEEAECQGEFTPQIPLPEEVVVTTGEEDEIVLFDERAKLFRFTNGEWKERGIGQMKVLQHRDTKKSRILMRREQVHKVCANHVITADIKFEAHTSSENSLVWAAHDFAEEQVVVEKFCIRFKTAEQTARFKKVCEEARELNKTLSTPTKSSQATVVSSSTAASTRVATTPVSVATTLATTPAFGFKVQPGSSLFSSPQQRKPADAAPGVDSYGEEYTPSATITSVIPLPDEVPVVTGEENETPLFSHHAKLYRYVNFEWKDLGAGELKILKHNETGNVRLVMRREHAHKVCANHFITADMELKKNFSNWMWCARDYAGEKMQNETFCVKFKTEDAEFLFEQAFEKGREMNKVAKPPSKPEAFAAVSSKAVASTIASTKPVSALFGQPAVFGSGERVSIGGFTMSSKPVLKPVEEISKSETESAPVPQTKPNPFSGLNFSSATTPIFGSSKVDAMPSFSSLASSVESTDVKEKTAPDQRPLNLLFKPKEGSWSCTACYISNTSDKTECVCCNTPKPGCEAKPAPKPNFFSGAGGFVFGTPKLEVSANTAQVGFGRGPSKPDDDSAVSSTPAPKPSSTDALPLSQIAAFKPKEGSWNCKDCYTPNPADKLKCVCCETAKPGCEGEAKQEGQKSLFSTGGLKSMVDLSTGGQTFSFGVPASAQSAPPTTLASGTTSADAAATKKVHINLQAPTYSFGMPKEDGKPKEKPKDAGFVFGATPSITASSASSNNNPLASFSFGSSSFAFNLQGMKSEESLSKSPGKDSTSGEEPGSDGEDDHDNIHFKPIIPLPDKVAVVTGEENEDVLFSHLAKLYRYVNKEWKERGTGDVKILKHKTDGRLRLLMRRAQVHKICLNHFLTPDIEFSSKDPRSLTWSAQDFSEGQLESTVFTIRFKDPDIASNFKSTIDKALVDYVSPSGKSKQADKGDGGKEQTNVDPKSGVARVLFKEPASSVDGDLEIVYETKVTPEEQEAALRLQLPANFYSYRRKPPCEGCQGCEKDEDEPDDKPAMVNESKFSFVSAADDTDKKPAQPLWATPSANKPVFSFGSFSSKPQQGTSLSPATSTKGSIFGGTPTTVTISSIFGGTPSTATTSSIFGGTQTTTTTSSIFGGTVTSSSTTTSIFGATNGSSAPIFGGPSSQLLFGKSVFNMAAATNTAADSTKTATLTFGGTASNTPSFGSSASNAPSFGSQAANAPSFNSATLTFGSAASTAAPSAVPTFGSVASSTAPTSGNVTSSAAPTFGSVASIAAPTFGSVASSAAPTFGSVASSAAPTFGSVASSAAPTFSSVAPSAAPTFSSVAFSADSTFGNVASNTAPIYGSVASSAAPTFDSVASSADPTFDSEASKEDVVEEGLSFLPVDNKLTFAAVSRNAKPLIKDSNETFKFAGAGTVLFASAISEADKSENRIKKVDDGDSSGDENETGHDNPHDPQFKPIIPLPDAIEVRTGEEDETRLFCEKAKLFRYSDKEWKERGIGEMKILYHPVRNSYRLLLRREQVHKVVLNLPLTVDMELSPLSTSDTAWCWGGMNYAEEPEGTLEKLAVRFKNVELTRNFKETLESCQEKLRLNRSTTADQEEADVVGGGLANSPYDESNNEEDPEHIYDYYVDPSDVRSYDRLLEETGDLEENYDGTWMPVGEATTALFVDSETGMGSIIVKKDDTVICQTAQSDDDIYTADGNYFEWTSFDLNAGSHRTLRIRLPSEEAALEFKTKLEDVVPLEGEVEDDEGEDDEDDGEGEEDDEVEDEEDEIK